MPKLKKAKCRNKPAKTKEKSEKVRQRQAVFESLAHHVSVELDEAYVEFTDGMDSVDNITPEGVVTHIKSEPGGEDLAHYVHDKDSPLTDQGHDGLNRKPDQVVVHVPYIKTEPSDSSENYVHSEDIESPGLLGSQETDHIKHLARQNIAYAHVVSSFNFEHECVKREELGENADKEEEQQQQQSEQRDHFTMPVAVIKLEKVDLASPSNGVSRLEGNLDGDASKNNYSGTTYPADGLGVEDTGFYIRLAPDSQYETETYSVTVNDGFDGQLEDVVPDMKPDVSDDAWELHSELPQPFPVSLHTNIHTGRQQQQDLDQDKTISTAGTKLKKTRASSGKKSTGGSSRKGVKRKNSKYYAHSYVNGSLVTSGAGKSKKKKRGPKSSDMCKYCGEWLGLSQDNSGVKCTRCQSVFHCEGSLVQHQKSHAPRTVPNAKEDRPYSCIYCGKQFTQKGNCKEHERIHTGEKRYQCQYCDKMFYTNSKATVHARIHTGEKRFQCSYCDKRFTESSKCVRHQRIHTGEKPYKCQYCDKAFSVKTNCSIHERLHRRDKPFECQICGKRFAQNGNRKEHEKTHERKEIRKMKKLMKSNVDKDLDKILQKMKKERDETKSSSELDDKNEEGGGPGLEETSGHL
ncbi:zinc finger protein 793 [Lingula anatina]|uniref:Zinc finger protein 793 n=1 Tax=Lingula anatina TaxID=7574 RepID=A0A1S3HDV0_LINAN|nr:zinc finger protein 793 [Lingula anatina]|eukprot:XP_013384205.1 zinc finger protein 793 [Lingula anatina]